MLSPNYSISEELQSTFEASRIEWPTFRNNIPCMAHFIQLGIGVFMSSPGVKGHTNSWETNEHYQQFGENESIDTGQSQIHWTEDNSRINKVSAMRLGLAKIIEKVHISGNFESPKTDQHIAANACWIDYTETRSSKRVHWLSKSQSTTSSTNYYGCEAMVEFDPGVGWVSLPIMRIHLWVAQESKVQLLPATFHNGG